jgi:hypothetical protein
MYIAARQLVENISMIMHKHDSGRIEMSGVSYSTCLDVYKEDPTQTKKRVRRKAIFIRAHNAPAGGGVKT